MIADPRNTFTLLNLPGILRCLVLRNVRSALGADVPETEVYRNTTIPLISTKKLGVLDTNVSNHNNMNMQQRSESFFNSHGSLDAVTMTSLTCIDKPCCKSLRVADLTSLCFT